MRTEDLIKALDADSRNKAMPLGPAWWLAVGVAVVVAAMAFFMTIGPRPDIMPAMHTVRFLSKFVFTLALTTSAFALIRVLSTPGAASRRAKLWMLAAPALVVIAVILELFVVPEAEWGKRLVGSNMMICMTFIPLIGIGPLAIFLGMLRYGAPTRPVQAGAVAGLLAGGLAATFYAAHCFDDSPLFVATWYTIAIAFLTALGALGGRFFVRW
ncbi:NrsF family protein [Mesorhizobium sp. VK23B]|uniref:NrsF family protein n=1 Tax=Mesorhizobium dulcispinae TaxID=3072316 RepID=A0ABU4XFS3_9HYPH|nr:MULTISPECIES: NrsF family protein [unclassified Mesorhizobium]MDX8467385.1 NrsF family protein [Mesorhizobium sp. VK23B]MDX8473627.1 NrsF family protein [Mesorhizobium sp. VK23A]